jgi:hypothetical protein
MAFCSNVHTTDDHTETKLTKLTQLCCSSKNIVAVLVINASNSSSSIMLESIALLDVEIKSERDILTVFQPPID